MGWSSKESEKGRCAPPLVAKMTAEKLARIKKERKNRGFEAFTNISTAGH